MLTKLLDRFSDNLQTCILFNLRPFSLSAIPFGRPNIDPHCTYPKLEKKQNSKLFKETLSRLQFPGTHVDLAMYASLLRFCGNEKALPDSKLVHDHIVQHGCEAERDLGSLIVQMYGKCGALEDASSWFATMGERDVNSWNFMIGAYVRHEQGNRAFQLFGQMEWEGLIPDKVTFVHILSACANQSALSRGKGIHDLIVKIGLGSDVNLGTGLVHMYGKCGSLEDARRIFDNMPQRNIVSWNSMIAVCVRLGHYKDALHLLEQMQGRRLIVDRVTFVSILQACAFIAEGRQMHDLITLNSLESDAVVATALVNMYSKCGSLEDARRVFDRNPKKDEISWTAMITAYAQQGQNIEALSLFTHMRQEGLIPDKVTFISVLDACESQETRLEGMQVHECIVNNGFELDVVLATALLNMYSNCGSLEDARMLFDKMFERNVISWNIIIAAHVQYVQEKEALELFDQMQLEGIRPDNITFVAVLDACSGHKTLARGKQIHIHLMQNGFEMDSVVATALVNMYGKCGSVMEARKVFDKTPKLDNISWTTMIAAYAQHGQGNKAFQLFAEMQQSAIIADKVTIISLLSACSHAGLLDEGWQNFISTRLKDCATLSNEHFDCIIDILARAGRLDEAESLINKMPFQPTAVSWITLFGACRDQLDVERGERIARHVLELDPWSTAPYVILSKITGRSGESEKLTIKMLDRKLQHISVLSDVRCVVHKLSVDDFMPHIGKCG